MRWKFFPFCLLLSTFITLGSGFSSAQESSCDCSTKAQSLPTASESKIIQQILRRENLQQAVLKTDFVEKLLTGKFKGVEFPHRVVEIHNATFDRALNLRNQDIRLEVRLIDCHFLKGLDFSLAHFLELWLNGSTFEPVNQPSNDAQTGINFDGMKVDANLYLVGTRFNGVPEFFHLAIGDDVHAEGASFLSGDLRFDQSAITGKLFLDHSQFRKSLILADITVRELSLKAVAVGRKLDLSNARVETVINMDLEGRPAEAVLDGLTYRDLWSGADTRLRALIGQSPYSARSYSQLEDYYRSHGDTDDADDIFIEGKQRDRGPFHWTQPLTWPGWLVDRIFLDLLLGYGRCPWRALVPSVILVALGTVIFWRNCERIIERKPDETKRPYHKSWRTLDPFWFSLDLFAPVIDLDASAIWMPKTDWRAGWYYLRALRILGWILVPLIVAALTGVIK